MTRHDPPVLTVAQTTAVGEILRWATDLSESELLDLPQCMVSAINFAHARSATVTDSPVVALRRAEWCRREAAAKKPRQTPRFAVRRWGMSWIAYQPTEPTNGALFATWGEAMQFCQDGTEAA
jgi:hypothetical protein